MLSSIKYALVKKIEKIPILQVFYKSYGHLSYCYDISNIAPPDGNVYHDLRHHGAKENKLIAEETFRIISEN